MSFDFSTLTAELDQRGIAYWQSGEVLLINHDCLAVLPLIPAGSVDVVIADPPYGCDKAQWDGRFFGEWYPPAKDITSHIVIIAGSAGVADAIRCAGADVVDVIAAWNTNSRTRGAIGFSNWLAATVCGYKPRQQQNIMRFAICGDMPDHPAPKPIEYMAQLVPRLTDDGDCVLDPVCGSGTTGVACVKTGRAFIGIEIHEPFYQIAKQRIAAAQHKCLPIRAEDAPLWQMAQGDSDRDAR